MGANDCLTLQPFIWAQQYKGDLATPALLLKSIGEGGTLDKRMAPLCLESLEIVDEYNFNRVIAVYGLSIMQPEGTVARLLLLIDEFLNTVGTKSDFEARLDLIRWDDLLSAVAETLQNLHTTNSQNKTVVVGKLNELLVSLKKMLDTTVSIKVLAALITWGETNLLEAVTWLLKCGDTKGEMAALQAIEKLADSWSEEERRLFVAQEFCNPSDYQRTVTLLFYRALNALAKADPSLGDPVSIKDAVDESMQLECYDEEEIVEWQITECETVAQHPTLAIKSIESYLLSNNSSVRKAAEYACRARGKEFTAKETALPWLHQTQNK